MISYRDMTFCRFHKDCLRGEDCFRALTDKVVLSAESIGLGTCEFTVTPHCFRARPVVNEPEREPCFSGKAG